MKRSAILISILIVITATSHGQPASAGLFGPNCKKVHPQGIGLKNQIERNYKLMINEKNQGKIQNAYATYIILNRVNNQLSKLMGSDKNFRCFLDAEYSRSTYAWSQEFEGRKYGGPVKNLCLLWGYGCKATTKSYANPCDEFILRSDYEDCIEDHARPTG